MEEFLTVEEVAEKLKVTRHTIYRWIREGRLKATRVVSVLRISEAEFRRFLEAEGGGPSGETKEK